MTLWMQPWRVVEKEDGGGPSPTLPSKRLETFRAPASPTVGLTGPARACRARLSRHPVVTPHMPDGAVVL